MSEAKLVEVGGEEVQKILRGFRDVLSNCYGPWGNQALLVSAPSGGGGAITLTRRSARLLQLLHADHSVTRHLSAHLQSHASCYRDSTLYAGMLACNLVVEGLNLQKPRRKVAGAVSQLLSQVGEWLKDSSCPVQRELDLNHVEQLLTFLTSYLGAKMSRLSERDLHHLATLLLKGFLRALPTEGSSVMSLDQVYFLPASCVPLGPAHCSTLHEGLLLSQTMCPSLPNLPAPRGGGRVFTVVVDSSLAGELAEGSEFSAQGAVCVSIDEVIEAELLAMGRVLVERGVGLLACQKCVHPALKEYLWKEGVVVVERVSSLLLGPVHKLCGGDLLSSPSPRTLRHCELGVVSAISKLQVLGQWYLQLQGVSDSHSTLVLCSDSEWNVDELHPLCRDALSLLEVCVTESQVLCGGGCADTCIADYIRSKGMDSLPPSLPGASDVVQMVAKCFERQACSLEKCGGQVLTDSVHHHCWFLPPCLDTHPSHSTGGAERTCGCGAISLREIPAHTSWRMLLSPDTFQPLLPLLPVLSDHTHSYKQKFPSILDLLTPRVAALTFANEICHSLLTTAFIITQHQ